MRSLMLTFICAISSLSFLASCGGAGLAGSSGRKEKTDKSNGMSASEPAVVTGAYLTCDYSPADDVPPAKAVGCSLMTADNERLVPGDGERLTYSASVENIAGEIAPNLLDSATWGAVWTSLTQISRTSFTGRFTSKDGILTELTCKSAPCKSAPAAPPKIAGSSATMLTGLNGVWRGNNSDWYLTSQGEFMGIPTKVLDRPAGPDELCSANGHVVDKSTAELRMQSFLSTHKTNDVYGAGASVFSSTLSSEFNSLTGVRQVPLPQCVKAIGGEILRSGSYCSVAIIRLQGSSKMSGAVFPLASKNSAETQLRKLPPCP